MTDHSLLELFREEVRQHTAVLAQGLLALEEGAGPRAVEPLMRAAHSIKGAARIMNVEAAVGLAHALEDVFVAVGQGRAHITPGDIDVLLRAADLLATLAQADLSTWGQDQRDELARLVDVCRALAARPAERVVVREEPAQPADLVPAERPPARLPVGPPAPPPPLVQVVATTTEPAPAQEDAVVRVTAQGLNRLMSLAGESLVQARWLGPFATALLHLKQQHDHLAGLLEHLAQALAHDRRDDAAERLLAEARQQAGHCRQVLTERMRDFEVHAHHAEDLNSRLYHEVISSRMRPFSDGAGGFPRLVRDMARKLDKQVRLEIDGQSTEVDRDILEKLEAPLTHLLRNAVDHGIEPPDERLAGGKPAVGLVRLEVRHRAGMLALAVSDDGRGVDLDRLRRQVVERGLTTADLAAVLTPGELLEFLFLPGFTTAGQVTEYSGRGVGLDVVRDMVRRVGGSVRIASRPGRGTTFHLSLPITLSVLRAVLVDIAGEPYAFPHNRIDRLLRVRRCDVRSLEHRQFVAVDGRNVGLVLAAQLFDLPAAGPTGDELPVVLVSDEAGQYGLVVEAFRGEQDLVVRPLDPRLGPRVPNVSAAAILDDGSPVLIADVEDLVRGMDQFIQQGSLLRCEQKEKRPEAPRRVLVVDDSITVREVERQLLRNEGYDVAVAVDGVDGWNQLRAAHFDLVVTDVDMPRLSGLELVKLIRDHERLKDLPIVIVSYKDREEDRLRGLDLGANCYLTKSSFHDNTFLEAVADLIGEA